MIGAAYLLAALFCLAYLFVMSLHAGFVLSNVCIWVFLAAFFAFSAAAFFIYPRHKNDITLRLILSAATLTLSGAAVLVALLLNMFGRIPVRAPFDLDYVIVLGSAPDSHGNMTETMRLRAEKAAEYAMENTGTLIILSGGKTRGETSEAALMQKFLKEMGLPEDRMVLEETAENTFQNIKYSLDIIDLLEAKKENATKRASIGIISSNFHVYRAGQLAKTLTGEDVSIIAAKADRVMMISDAIRDAAAIIKEKIAGNL